MGDFELRIDGEDISNTRLYMAIQDRDAHKVLEAIYQGENVNLRDQEFQSTYLHLLVSIADPVTEPKLVPMVYQLANTGIDVNAKDYKGRTALDLAIHRQLEELMVALIRVGVDLKEKDYYAVIKEMVSPFELELIGVLEKFEPGMWHIVATDNVSMAHMLINSWCRINIHKKGVSLLQYARRTKKSEELIDILDYYEVTIEFVLATLAGDEKRMLELLMDSKPCDPYIMDISYQERWSQPLTPRSLRDAAISLGHTHVLHLLPEEETGENTENYSPEINAQSNSLCGPSEQSESNNNSDSLAQDLDTSYQSIREEQDEDGFDCSTKSSKGYSKHSGKLDSSLSTSKPHKSRKASTWSKARSRIWKGSTSKRSSLDDSALGQSNTDNKISNFVTPKRSSKQTQYLYHLHEYGHNWESDISQKKTTAKTIGKDTKSKLCVIS